uniref:DP-EP family protein n=1 Tax=Cellvibrio fontiphilus TaxID=1815559 RepID=UPI002B4BE15A|nr:DP-EP family protein [Cellvibrio fontiphilus]
MADAKKKTDKKTAEKKPAKKAVANAKAVVKKGKKNLTATDLTILVPRGGQVIKYFNLTPALPTDSGRGDWLFTEVGSSKDIQNLTVGFELNPSALERQLERAVLVVSMSQNPAAHGTWRFALGGVATDHSDEDPHNDVVVDIIDNGFTLIVYVQVLENSEENIPFGFVASFTDNDTGVVSIYESQDPAIQPVRPPKP